MILYGSEAWALLTDAVPYSREKSFSPVRVDDDFRIRFNRELPLDDINIVQSINIQPLRLLGHVVHMEKDAPTRRGSVEVDEEDDLVSVGRTKSRKTRHRLV